TTILVGLDGSEAAKAGVEAARKLCGPGSRVVLFTVLPMPDPSRPPAPDRVGWRWPAIPESAIPTELPAEAREGDRRTDNEQIREETLSRLDTVAEEFHRQGIDAACEMTFGNDAAEEILTEAEHQRADLIVVGSAGHS